MYEFNFKDTGLRGRGGHERFYAYLKHHPQQVDGLEESEFSRVDWQEKWQVTPDLHIEKLPWLEIHDLCNHDPIKMISATWFLL